MRRTILTGALVAAMVPFLMNGATATGFKLPARLMKPSGTVSVDPSAGSTAPLNLKPGPVPPNPHSVACADHSATDVRANQECTNQSTTGFFGRAQSQNETAVAVNPTNPKNVLISQNDYRRGDGNCGVDFSLDGGKHFGSTTANMGFAHAIFEGGARHYWNAGGDTSVAFDTSGEAYLMCQAFDRGFPTNDMGDMSPFGASSFLLFRSHDGGASWSFPGDYVTYTQGAFHGGLGLLDKQYMSIDTGANSPYKDRIYVAWTNYPQDFSTAPIYLAYSSDHGVTWHQSGEISGFNKNLCPNSLGGDPSGTCNNSSFAQPFSSPNGDVFVVFTNANNALSGTDNHQQILIVKSTDGGGTFGKPQKVSDYYELPDCVTYTGDDAGRACVPTAPLSNKSVFRATNYPSGVALDNNNIVVDVGSYINKHSNPSHPEGQGFCRPNGFADSGFPLYVGIGETSNCNNDILRSVSTDGGATFTGTSTPPKKLPSVNDEAASYTDQWFQWLASGPGGELVDSYMDRKYGDDQSTGYMDVTLATPSAHIRVTDASNPPSNEFPGSGGYSTFLGDYNGLAVGSDGIAHPAWPDTRNPIFTFDDTGGTDARKLTFAGYGSDIYTASIPIAAHYVR